MQRLTIDLNTFKSHPTISQYLARLNEFEKKRANASLKEAFALLKNHADRHAYLALLDHPDTQKLLNEQNCWPAIVYKLAESLSEIGKEKNARNY